MAPHCDEGIGITGSKGAPRRHRGGTALMARSMLIEHTFDWGRDEGAAAR
jgi:hypothetical protein